MRSVFRVLLVVVVAIGSTAAAFAQPSSTSGSVTIAGDLFPNRDNTTELRARVFVEELLDPSPHIRMTLSGFAEGLVARRPTTETPHGEQVNAADAEVVDASVTWKTKHADLLAGFARMSWGRLDELQPTDVVNPLDASRFFFESRSEARLPVGLVRVRAYLTDNTTIEGVYVPFFRRGRFDQLDEPTSPFNLEHALAGDQVACLAIGCPVVLPVSVARHEPAATLSNGQGGVRFNTTSGTFDWSVSAYRGLEPFGLATAGRPLPDSAFVPVNIIYPRFTMLGGDFETVRGLWGVRGEVAAFVEDNFQGSLRIVSGASVDAGVGVDRQAGPYRISGTALFHHETYDQPLLATPNEALNGRSNLSLIVAADRTFARERYRVRTFGVYTPDESNAFLRAIGVANLRDNLALEGSVGWFAGEGQNLIGTFANSDFLYARLKYDF
jgi:hypothetical protein